MFDSLSLDVTGMAEVTRRVKDLGGVFSKARKSAMGSVGWYVMGELRNHLEYGPPEWEELGPITKKYKKKRDVAHNWIRRRVQPRSPALWLGKFARYRVATDGHLVQIDFGKGKRGKKPGRLDPELSEVARRIDGGEKIRVTKAMRRKMAATWFKAGKNPQIGVNFFPLKKSTHSLEIPARPIFAPVFAKVKPVVPRIFEEKFWKALERKR